MAHELDQITSLLDVINSENNAYCESAGRLLYTVNNRLVFLKNKNSSELVRLYYSEFAKSLNNLYKNISQSFRNSEKSVEEILNIQTKEEKEGLTSFEFSADNIQKFYNLADSAAADLKELKKEIKTDTQKVNAAADKLIRIFNSAFDKSVSDLKTVSENLSEYERNGQKSSFEKQYAVIIQSLKSIEDYLKMEKTKNNLLEKLIFNILTSENLKIIKGAFNIILEKAATVYDNAKTANKNIPMTSGSELKNQNSPVDIILSKSADIKQILGSLTPDIEALPDFSQLNNCLSEIYSTLEDLDFQISLGEFKADDHINEKTAEFVQDFLTVKNIVDDLYEILKSKIRNLFEKIPFDKDISAIEDRTAKILSASASKEHIKSVLMPDVYDKTNEADDTETIRETQTIDDDFDNIYAKSTNQDKWLINSASEQNLSPAKQYNKGENPEEVSKVLKTTGKIVEKLENLTNDNSASKQDITSDIREEINALRTELINSQRQLREDLSGKIQKINSDENFDNLISRLYEVKPADYSDKFEKLKDEVINSQQENSNKVLEKISKISSEINNDIAIESAKNEITNNQYQIRDSLIEKLSDLNTAVEKAVSSDDLIDFAKALKNVLNQVIDNTRDNAQFDDLRKDISDRLNNIDFSSITSYLEEHFNSIKEIINKQQTVENNEDILKDKFLELKELIQEKKADFENASANSLLKSVEQHFEEIKNLISTSNSEIDSKTIGKISDIEKQISDYNALNKKIFDDILQKFNAYDSLITDKDTDVENSFKSSSEEISSIKKQIEDIGQTFKNIKLNGSSENNAAGFVSEKLEEIGSNLKDLNDNINGGLQQGFTYNSELIEEKSSALLDMIKELRHASTGNVELFERLTVADNKLMDLKQELELVNTDVTNIFNSKTDTVIEALNALKTSVEGMADNGGNAANGSELLVSVKELIENIPQGAVPSASGRKIEEFYNDITQKLEENQNGIRDFLLSDIDSVIIKIDNIKDYISEKLESVVPPNTKDIKELNNFISQIKNFKKDNENYFKNVEKSINDNINEKHDELKSMISVAMNNSEILKAINNIKEYFAGKTEEVKNLSSDYEPEIVEEGGEEILNDLRAEFDEFSKQMNSLSGQNTDIEYILNQISEKIDTLHSGTDKNDTANKENDFDFVKAFDLLSNDIKNLKGSLEGVLQANNKNSSSGTAGIKQSSEQAEQLLQASGQKWFEEIKKYLADNELKNIVNEVNNKIDILALTNNQNDENSEEIKNLLNTLNSKVDVLAANDNFELIEDIKDSIEAIKIPEQDTQIKDLINTLSAKIDVIAESNNIRDLEDSDSQITSMLETLNHKIDIIAETETGVDKENDLEDIKSLILEQKNYIEKLEPNEKLSAFKKCLDELSAEVNNLSSNDNSDLKQTLKDMKESIMEAVVSIFSQVSFVEESEDIKDFVEEKTDIIAKNLEEVTKQIKQITSSDESGEDYTYSMQDIETDLAKLRLALKELQNSSLDAQTGELTNIADTLNRITSTVDSLSQDEIQDLKSDITNLKEQTKHLLLSSDASFSTLNNDVINKVDKVTQMLEKSGDSDKVMRQALIYIGEWIDSASDSMNKISSNSEEILNVKSSIEENFENQQEHLTYMEQQMSKLESLEAGFEQQEARIDKLEKSLDKILSIVEDIDSSGLMRKVEKIDKQLLKLSSNIEKLASYVD